jgi:hypothetical protein
MISIVSQNIKDAHIQINKKGDQQKVLKQTLESTTNDINSRITREMIH